MRVRLLGTAAGGGLPQWNCRCANCRAARRNLIAPLSQCSLAFSPAGQDWYLVNATPDVTQQLSRWEELHPQLQVRSSPIRGVILSDGELDHTLGLLQLREGSPWTLYATAAVAKMLEDRLCVLPALRQYNEIRVRELSPNAPLLLDEATSRLEVRVVETGRHLPRYLGGRAGEPDAAVLGVILTDLDSGTRLVYAPCVGELSASLRDQLRSADVIFFDGTFWSDDELRRLGIGTSTATDMGHVPVGGAEGSALWLSKLPARTKQYVHLNNTNRLLDPASEERAWIRTLGLEVAAEGWMLTL